MVPYSGLAGYITCGETVEINKFTGCKNMVTIPVLLPFLLLTGSKNLLKSALICHSL